MRRHLAFVPITVIVVILIITACKDHNQITEPQSVSSSQEQTFMKIAENSSSVKSFTPNYNEEQAMTLAGTMGKDLYPIRIGQKMTLVDKSLTLAKDSTTATGTFVQKYNGTLIIEGSFQQPTIGIRSHVDTTIQKTFTTTITRMIKYQRVAKTGNDTTDWKIVAISLPNGGTDGTNIQITKLTLTAQDGSQIVIDDPNTYFFNVGNDKDGDDDNDYNKFHDGMSMNFGASFEGHGWFGLFTWYHRNQPVKLSVEVLSSSNDPDLLTITYGSTNNGNFKTKEKFDLVSSTLQGTLYKKVYERDWYTGSYSGRMHAVINALPRSVAYDTNTSVEEKTWGIPYRVN